jgi:hypothetical protein
VSTVNALQIRRLLGLEVHGVRVPAPSKEGGGGVHLWAMYLRALLRDFLTWDFRFVVHLVCTLCTYTLIHAACTPSCTSEWRRKYRAGAPPGSPPRRLRNAASTLFSSSRRAFSFIARVGDPLAVAEHAVAQVRAQVRALGYDLALIPLPAADHHARLASGETT